MFKVRERTSINFPKNRSKLSRDYGLLVPKMDYSRRIDNKKEMRTYVRQIRNIYYNIWLSSPPPKLILRD